MAESMIEQEIRRIVINDREEYRVGRWDVSRIEIVGKAGLAADIPYVRIWRGEHCHAEFCQHQIRGLYFYGPVAEERNDG